MESFAALAREIAVLTGSPCADAPGRTVTGGSINTCYYWPADPAPMFVKVGPRAAHDAFAAEAEGLRELQAARALRGCSKLCLRCLPVTGRAPRSCTGICGAETGSRALRASRCYSIPRSITATARPISP